MLTASFEKIRKEQNLLFVRCHGENEVKIRKPLFLEEEKKWPEARI
jgi:hypothetical protein